MLLFIIYWLWDHYTHYFFDSIDNLVDVPIPLFSNRHALHRVKYYMNIYTFIKRETQRKGVILYRTSNRKYRMCKMYQSLSFLASSWLSYCNKPLLWDLCTWIKDSRLEVTLKFNLVLAWSPILQHSHHPIVQPALEYSYWQDTHYTPTQCIPLCAALTLRKWFLKLNW